VSLRHLRGVGDESLQWAEWTGYAFHVRRRLTADEQKAVGPALDLRGTDSAARRYNAVKDDLPAAAVALAMQEINDTGTRSVAQ
jgi:hypothetical protein